jgi:hypothetical protein
MSEQLHRLSPSIVELANEIDGQVAIYGKGTPNEDTAAVVAARLALDRLLAQSKSLDELLYQSRTEELLWGGDRARADAEWPSRFLAVRYGWGEECR